MVEIERVRRPFWTHQLVEYLIGIGLISASVQMQRRSFGTLAAASFIILRAVSTFWRCILRMTSTVTGSRRSCQLS